MTRTKLRSLKPLCARRWGQMSVKCRVYSPQITYLSLNGSSRAQTESERQARLSVMWQSAFRLCEVCASTWALVLVTWTQHRRVLVPRALLPSMHLHVVFRQPRSKVATCVVLRLWWYHAVLHRAATVDDLSVLTKDLMKSSPHRDGPKTVSLYDEISSEWTAKFHSKCLNFQLPSRGARQMKGPEEKLPEEEVRYSRVPFSELSDKRYFVLANVWWRGSENSLYTFENKVRP